MSEQKSAQLQVNAQDHRIRELSAELTHSQQCRYLDIVCGEVQR